MADSHFAGISQMPVVGSAAPIPTQAFAPWTPPAAPVSAAPVATSTPAASTPANNTHWWTQYWPDKPPEPTSVLYPTSNPTNTWWGGNTWGGNAGGGTGAGGVGAGGPGPGGSSPSGWADGGMVGTDDSMVSEPVIPPQDQGQSQQDQEGFKQLASMEKSMGTSPQNSGQHHFQASHPPSAPATPTNPLQALQANISSARQGIQNNWASLFTGPNTAGPGGQGFDTQQPQQQQSPSVTQSSPPVPTQGVTQGYADGGEVGGPTMIGTDAPMVSAPVIPQDQSSPAGPQMASQDSSSDENDDEDYRQEEYDDAQLARIHDAGPAGGEMPYGMPQVADEYGNPSKGVTDGVNSGAKALAKDSATQGIVPNEAEASKGKFHDPDSAVDKATFDRLKNAVDPSGALHSGMDNLAVIEAMHKYGAQTGQDTGPAIGAVLQRMKENSMEYGIKAVHALDKGDTKSAMDNLVLASNEIPSGTHYIAQENKDGTYHIEKTDMHGKLLDSKDLDKDQLYQLAHGFGIGQAFLQGLGKDLSKYDPENTRGETDPIQAGYQRAYAQNEAKLTQVFNQMSPRYIDQHGNPVMDDGRVFHMPQQPTYVGIPQLDKLAQETFQNNMRMWQDLRSERMTLLRENFQAYSLGSRENLRVQLQEQGQAYIQQRADKAASQRQERADKAASQRQERDFEQKQWEATKIEQGQKEREKMAQEGYKEREKMAEEGRMARTKEASRVEQAKMEAPLSLTERMFDKDGQESNLLNEATKATAGVNIPGVTSDQNKHALAFGTADIMRYNRVPPTIASDVLNSLITSKNFDAKKDAKDIEGAAGDKRIQINLTGQEPFVMSPRAYAAAMDARAEFATAQAPKPNRTEPTPPATSSPTQGVTGGALPLPSSIGSPSPVMHGHPQPFPAGGFMDWLGKNMITEDQPSTVIPPR